MRAKLTNEGSNFDIVNPFYNNSLGDHLFFLVTLTNCDLNVYRHIPYKTLQDCDYIPKKKLTKYSLCPLIKMFYFLDKFAYFLLLCIRKLIF